MKRKLLSVFLALLMVLTLLPASARAEGNPVSGSCGENAVWAFEEATGTLTISGTGDMGDFPSGNPAPWLAWKEKILAVEIEEGITSIGAFAFAYCAKLESVSIPDSVTHIWVGAFFECKHLGNVQLHENIVHIGNSAFEDCTRMTMVTVRGGGTVIGHAAFRGCTALEKVTIGANTWEIGWSAFQNCTSLRQIAFEGSYPSYISHDAFTAVTATAYYPGEDDSWTEDVFGSYGGDITWVSACAEHDYHDSVCRICGMEDPDKVIPPVVPVTSGPCGENTRWAFEEATGTMTISGTGPTYDYNGRASLPWFEYLQGIKTLIVEPGVTELGNSLVSGAMQLSRVELPEGLTRIGKATFDYAIALEEVDLPDSLTYIGEIAFWYSGLKRITIPASVETVAHKAFWFCSALEEIVFEGDAPEFLEQGVFIGVTATAYYPAGNPTWTEEVRTWCGGDVVWVAQNGAKVIRLSGANRYLTGFAVADQLKENLGIDKFEAVVVAYGQNFPDALTGSYLAAVKNAPILLTETSVDHTVAAYIDENLVSGGTVYILGGSAAVSESFELALWSRGFRVVRLKGAGRYETNLAILKEAGVNTTDEVLIATGKNYADSLSASATGLPMLLVDKELTASQRAFLEGTSKKFVILGGTGAVSAEVAAELASMGTVTRVKGASRYDTSVEIAKRYFDNPRAAVLAYAQGFPDGLCGGPLAISMGAPMILTSNDNYAPADAYIEGITSGVVTGGTGRISDETVWSIFDTVS